VTEIRRIRSEQELQAALALREAVFCGEQGVTFEGDRDGRDREAVQLVAVEDGELVGTCRVLMVGDDAKFGRLAVRRDARGRGIGGALLRAAEAEARTAGAARMGLAAQTGAIGLYAHAGFTAYGAEYEDEGIPHRNMEKSLA
jgi:predicted GNAT family N-acyltransferase